MNKPHSIKEKIESGDRERLLQQHAKVIWFTGLSGSGKSTLARHLEARLHQLDFKTYLLDGDDIRAGLNQDLGFTDQDRNENLRRIGEVSRLFLDAGFVLLSAFISPFHAHREMIRNTVGFQNYIEVFVDCPLSVCEQRDVKGLYNKARTGQLKNFTGIDSPYERPVSPDITIHTDVMSVDDAVEEILQFILKQIKVG